ncbi:hypothetical protein W97_04081 [Coniosporium apollinis CBS 100218]|uniref:Protein arginine methyltransferase NDUFAF7 n=1 Tax=Coniosporium apollinis (strain CBS 100218) TaxID=1168221 RepID=R7YSD9_CONA1|nr:uncharacterized protein W97_04081 [Coniosporium apollinis CBS 100218]EON64847.1 hypothetical protein W97_04081 [Coniosporium apollinis CBS 100218]
MRIQTRLAIKAVSRCAHLRSAAPAAFWGARWSSTATRQWSTPLAKHLAEAISTTGPVPVAAYMRQCLTSPEGGYYTSRTEGRDQFGQKGDFVTSPEISQVFGELIGIWVVAEWMAQGRKSSGVHIIEVGPGRGTLMDDMLRTIRNFKPLASSIEAIYLVEASPSLREAQKKLLCGDAPMEEIDIGHQSTSKYSDQLKIIWCEDMRFIPKGPLKRSLPTPFIIAHEFFDALPIHVFQSVAQPATPASTILTPTGTHATRSRTSQPSGPQWRELLVSPTPPSSVITTKQSPTSDPPPDFQLSLSKASTPHSLYLPQTSPRYAALLPHADSIIEISPESLALAADFAARIGGTPKAPKPAPSGAALILDYGPLSTIPTNSLRGIRHHTRVSPFSLPGEVDISADVDFVGLAEAAINASSGVEVHGPVEQARFLGEMGIEARAAALVARAGGIEERKRIEGGWRRLVERGPQGMGRLYKAMAIVPHDPRAVGGRRPVGFGGDVRG